MSKDLNAVKLGKKGGQTRAKKYTFEQLSEFSKKGQQTKIAKRLKENETHE